MEIYVKKYSISVFHLYFLVFSQDFIIYIDFTRSSKTATNDDTHQVTHAVT